MLNHVYVGTEHILLGLIHEGEGIAAEALGSLNVSLEAARQQVERIIGRGLAAPTGHIPFTPRAKTVFELAFREALRLSHDHIGTEHLLLGLIREGEGVGAQILQRLGGGSILVRATVMQRMGDSLVGPEGVTQMADEPTEPPSPFGERERVVLQLVDSGKTATEIAEVFEWPRATVVEIVEGIVAKLGRVLRDGEEG